MVVMTAHLRSHPISMYSYLHIGFRPKVHVATGLEHPCCVHQLLGNFSACIMQSNLAAKLDLRADMMAIQVTMQAFEGMMKRNYRCNGLTGQSADACSFVNTSNGQSTSVSAYFLKRYGKR